MNQLPPADLEMALRRKARRTRAERAAERLKAPATRPTLIELVRPCRRASVCSMSGPQTEDFLPENRAAEKLVGLGCVGRTPDEAAGGKKGINRHFGMKMHAAADECIGIAAN